MLPRINRIVSVEPYKVTFLWNTGQVREVDLQPMLAKSSSKPNSPINKISDKQLFKQVKM